MRCYEIFWCNVDDTLYRPMSQISAILGTDNDDEILQSLYLIVNVSDFF